MNFLKLFRRKKKVILLENKYPIEEVFTHKGIKYFAYTDIKNAPSYRMFAALIFFNEMEMNADKEYLKKHTDAMDRIIDNNKNGVSIKYIVKLNENLKERIQLMTIPEYIYRFASVVYFTEDESPYMYEFGEKQDKKIQRWREDPDMLHFFSSGPLKTLAPFLELLPKDINIFSPILEKLDKQHREQLDEIHRLHHIDT